MTTVPASCAWAVASVRASFPHGSPGGPAPSARPGVADRRLTGDRGEGVISVAIAVLIMAFLAALMWVGFQTMWKSTETRTNQQVDQIGRG